MRVALWLSIERAREKEQMREFHSASIVLGGIVLKRIPDLDCFAEIKVGATNQSRLWLFGSKKENASQGYDFVCAL